MSVVASCADYASSRGPGNLATLPAAVIEPRQGAYARSFTFVRDNRGAQAPQLREQLSLIQRK
jgi:hypothetical protein